MKKKILAISGSTRASSSNKSLIKAIEELSKDRLEITFFEGLEELPHFNPDIDNGQVPEKITEFRNELRKFDGILICTPEYAMGVPGTLKNAIDWTVSSMEFSHKPVALITASSVGKKGHQSLLDTLQIIEADIPESSQLLISFVKTKITGDTITDPSTLEQVKSLIDSFVKTLSTNS